ncbi:DUF397 domain-containing protein [Streptomyces scabiei]|uniref:DUF397 domain-containing protein n=1 Tax=Streptomyces scabiei TaxID=1930 RepID=UPI0029A99E3D|nr:DUF397 domain-containing protein [Streptomyces scabiei]MDX3115955.1 DUF397 domain-containing protein [Streptomyces scabiei]
MSAIDLSSVTWRKSSYSNSDGGECVEVSDDLLSLAAWRKSSYSNSDGGNCLEVADNVASVVPVRDSKDPGRGVLVFGAQAWGRFVEAYRSTSM